MNLWNVAAGCRAASHMHSRIVRMRLVAEGQRRVSSDQEEAIQAGAGPSLRNTPLAHSRCVSSLHCLDRPLLSP